MQGGGKWHKAGERTVARRTPSTSDVPTTSAMCCTVQLVPLARQPNSLTQWDRTECTALSLSLSHTLTRFKVQQGSHSRIAS